MSAQRSLFSRLLARVAARFPFRVLPEGGDPYLYRYLVWGPREGGRGWRVFLHRFVRSDEDHELHNHPWAFACALILAGGYREERRGERILHPHPAGSRYRIDVFERRPGTVVAFTGETFHRVDLLGDECWTLFVCGPAVQSWGFWNRYSGVFAPWREFVAAKGLRPVVGAYRREVRDG